ncbi:MAG: ABC transporter ATP-binding protein [Deltaproteobacteria bacterium]|nr:ABC transporter ATP-binding protein [Deltaproteobacteria bacterium]
MNAIEISGIKKSFQNVHALKGVDLAIRQGEFFGLLGPNGAGKTTLISAIMGLVRPDAGTIQVMGYDTRRQAFAAKKLMALCPQEINVHTYFPIQKIMEFQGGFYGFDRKTSKQRAEELLKRFGLWEKRKVGKVKLSGGMQRRLMIARSLMSDPKILILDEPTAGVDVELRHELWDFLKKINQNGRTILLTTHYIEEAEQLCGRVAIIHEGKIVACDAPQTLISQHTQKAKPIRRFVRPGTLEEVFVNLTGKRMEEAQQWEIAPRL